MWRAEAGLRHPEGEWVIVSGAGETAEEMASDFSMWAALRGFPEFSLTVASEPVMVPYRWPRSLWKKPRTGLSVTPSFHHVSNPDFDEIHVDYVDVREEV